VLKIVAEKVGKKFGLRTIIKGIDLEIESGSSLVITGPNGSGKTTLIRMLCGLVRPTEGKVTYFVNGQKPMLQEKTFAYIGLVGPYLELYEDLTANENIRFFAGLKNIDFQDPRIDDLFERFGLHSYRNQVIKGYSSGMRQRLKYIFALLAQPEVLFLDEQTSNLDSAGSEQVYTIMQEQKEDKILIFATNMESEIKFGDKQIGFHL
jgi:heme exporter protein A